MPVLQVQKPLLPGPSVDNRSLVLSRWFGIVAVLCLGIGIWSLATSGLKEVFVIKFSLLTDNNELIEAASRKRWIEFGSALVQQCTSNAKPNFLHESIQNFEVDSMNGEIYKFDLVGKEHDVEQVVDHVCTHGFHTFNLLIAIGIFFILSSLGFFSGIYNMNNRLTYSFRVASVIAIIFGSVAIITGFGVLEVPTTAWVLGLIYLILVTIMFGIISWKAQRHATFQDEHIIMGSIDSNTLSIQNNEYGLNMSYFPNKKNSISFNLNSSPSNHLTNYHLNNHQQQQQQQQQNNVFNYNLNSSNHVMINNLISSSSRSSSLASIEAAALLQASTVTASFVQSRPPSTSAVFTPHAPHSLNHSATLDNTISNNNNNNVLLPISSLRLKTPPPITVVDSGISSMSPLNSSHKELLLQEEFVSSNNVKQQQRQQSSIISTDIREYKSIDSPDHFQPPKGTLMHPLRNTLPTLTSDSSHDAGLSDYSGQKYKLVTFVTDNPTYPGQFSPEESMPMPIPGIPLSVWDDLAQRKKLQQHLQQNLQVQDR